jgi:hypothetical protein
MKLRWGQSVSALGRSDGYPFSGFGGRPRARPLCTAMMFPPVPSFPCRTFFEISSKVG